MKKWNWKKDLTQIACYSGILYSAVLEYKHEYLAAIYWLLVVGFIMYFWIKGGEKD